MSIKNIIDQIENTDAAALQQKADRREMLSSFGAKVAMAALPLAIGSLLSGKATAQTNNKALIQSVNLVLEFKYMQYTYYRQANNTIGLIPANDAAGFKAIEAQEKAHIDLLIKLVKTLGGVAFTPKYYTDPTTVAPYVPAAYDFTAAGKYTPFASYTTFLILAQVFEDTAIHALKGQMSVFTTNTDVMVNMFQIQAVEGRQAAYIRLVRRLPPISAPEEPAPWITNNIPPTIALKNYYLTEENVEHNGIIITSLPNIYYADGRMPQASATAAFDEAYDITTSLNLIAPFKKA